MSLKGAEELGPDDSDNFDADAVVIDKCGAQRLRRNISRRLLELITAKRWHIARATGCSRKPLWPSDQ